MYKLSGTYKVNIHFNLDIENLALKITQSFKNWNSTDFVISDKIVEDFCNAHLVEYCKDAAFIPNVNTRHIPAIFIEWVGFSAKKLHSEVPKELVVEVIKNLTELGYVIKEKK